MILQTFQRVQRRTLLFSLLKLCWIRLCDIYQFMEMKDTSLCDQDLPNLKLHQDEDGKRERKFPSNWPVCFS